MIEKLIELWKKNLEFRTKLLDNKIKFYPILLILIFIVVLGSSFINNFFDATKNIKINNPLNDIYFYDVSGAIIYNNAIELKTPYIDNNKKIIYDVNIRLLSIEDSISYNIKILNSSNIDKKISIVPIMALDEEQKNMIDIKYYYSDGTELISGDILKSGEYKDITVKIKYKDNIKESQLSNELFDIECYFMISGI